MTYSTPVGPQVTSAAVGEAAKREATFTMALKGSAWVGSQDTAGGVVEQRPHFCLSRAAQCEVS